MKRPNFKTRKSPATAYTFVEGKIVDLTRQAVLFSQQFCRCFSQTECNCTVKKIWIPKSLIKRNSIYDAKSPAIKAGLDLWEKGSAKFLIPTWKFQELIGDKSA